MIFYDSLRWRSLLRFHGSVLPRSMLWAFPSALVAFTLKYLEQEGYISLEKLSVLTQGDIYSGFTFVSGFSLVFRTSQAYARYWSAATSVHEMASEWGDSCASLVAFVGVSGASYEEKLHFKHTLIRLFSLLHAMAMSEVSCVDELPLIDVEGLSTKRLAMLTSSLAQGRKVQIVLCWIKAFITQSADIGVLTIPAPLLTRVFQELGAGLVKFHTAQQVVIWPFPFPYTQLNVLLINIYTLLTPLVVSTWQTWPWICAVFTFVSVTCFLGLDLIASELENPFGDDPNDLPVKELQQDMNKFLTVLIDPNVEQAPELLPTANMDHLSLAHQSLHTSQTRLSLVQCLSARPTPQMRRHLKRSLSMARNDRMMAQMKWCGRQARNSELERLQEMLHLRAMKTGLGENAPPAVQPQTSSLSLGEEHALRQEETRTQPAVQKQTSKFSLDVDVEKENTVVEGCSLAGLDEPSPSESPPDSPLKFCRHRTRSGLRDDFGLGRCNSRSEHGLTMGTDVSTRYREAPDWNEFISALHVELKEHLDKQLEIQLEVQKQELGGIRSLLTMGLGSVPPDCHWLACDDKDEELEEDESCVSTAVDAGAAMLADQCLEPPIPPAFTPASKPMDKLLVTRTRSGVEEAATRGHVIL